MNKPFTPATGNGLRQRMIEDMTVRGFSAKTQHDYLRIVERFAAFLGRSPDLAMPEDIRRFQVEQREAGMPAPAMNSHISGLRFFFTTTIDRPDLSRKLLRVSYPRKLPIVLSPDEVARLLGATTCIKHRAALSVAYGAEDRRYLSIGGEIFHAETHAYPLWRKAQAHVMHLLGENETVRLNKSLDHSLGRLTGAD